RDSRLRRMRFDDSDARRAANGSLVRLAPLWSVMVGRSAAGVRVSGLVPYLMFFDDSAESMVAASRGCKTGRELLASETRSAVVDDVRMVQHLVRACRDLRPI
ncbi:hypothetical protein, partial [Nocardia sp. NPDC049707]|uniref:hypothetical protein n=1 Tax=Nocardia sp. NPDC049707 TaxID=3154735 RepID=UPI003436D765